MSELTHFRAFDINGVVLPNICCYWQEAKHEIYQLDKRMSRRILDHIHENNKLHAIIDRFDYIINDIRLDRASKIIAFSIEIEEYKKGNT
jgi:hypothetical protein